MTFRWAWFGWGIAGLWAAGWFVSVVVWAFLNPLDSAEEKRRDLRARLLGLAVMNLVLWPWLLPAILERRKFYREMRTGKRPNWIVLSNGEQSGRSWAMSDGTGFGASVHEGASSEPSIISADYDDDSLTGRVEYRLKQIAPTPGEPTNWTRLDFRPRGPQPDPDDEDAVDDYVSSRFEVKVRVPRGKHEVQFRVENRSGKLEEFSGVILIVADSKDYDI